MKIINFSLLFPLLFFASNFVYAANNSNKVSFGQNGELDFQGSSNFTAAARNQSSNYEQKQLDDGTNNRQTQTPALENNSQLYLKLVNKSELNSVPTSQSKKFGFLIKIESETSSAQNKAIINTDQAFVFSEFEDYGKIEIGDNIAVNQKMKVGPASFARGSGGINGNYLKYLNLPTTGNFILIAQLPIGHGGYASSSKLNQNSIKILRNYSFNGSEDATKINYYSARINGLQVGISYTPNTSNSLISTTVFNGKNNAIIDVLSFGSNYTNSFDNFDYAFSLTAEKGKTRLANQNNLFAYDVATTMAYFGFTFGTSYGSWQKSLQNSDQHSKNATYKTLGISYQLGHLSISLTNLKSSFQKNNYQATSLGLDYKLSKAFMPYFEITQFRLNPNRNISTNSGFIVLGGFLLSF